MVRISPDAGMKDVDSRAKPAKPGYDDRAHVHTRTAMTIECSSDDKAQA